MIEYGQFYCRSAGIRIAPFCLVLESWSSARVAP
jgi:hypothetical protein